MARPKLAETINQTDKQTSPEELEAAKKTKNAESLHQQIMGMIDQMARNVSVDKNKHEIVASIFTRMEQWANKQLAKPGNVFEVAGVEGWESLQPKYINHITKCAEERIKRVDAWRQEKATQARKKFQDDLVKAIEAR